MFGFKSKTKKEEKTINNKIGKDEELLGEFNEKEFLKNIEMHIMPEKFLKIENDEAKGKSNSILIIIVIFSFLIIIGILFYLFKDNIAKFLENGGQAAQVIVEPVDKRNGYVQGSNILSPDDLIPVDDDKSTSTVESDIIPPAISSCDAKADAAGKGALITWQTDELSTSQILYGTSTNNYLFSSGVDNKLAVKHKIQLENLTEANKYYYIAIAKDSSDNISTSTENSFVMDDKGPVISSLNAAIGENNKVLITWVTDEPSTSKVQYGTLSENYSASTFVDKKLKINHSVELAKLLSNSKYYYIVISNDFYNNRTISTENFFISESGDDVLDEDKDGLTYLEEALFASDKLNVDTDGDSYLDGVEIINLYDPTEDAPTKIIGNVYIKNYSNNGYSIFYPQSWEIKEEEGKVLFIAKNGEFIELFISPNPEVISIFEWYKIQSGIDLKEMEGVEEINNKSRLKGVKVNEKNVYFNENGNIYVLTYNNSATDKENFLAVFEMMWQSLKVKGEE